MRRICTNHANLEYTYTHTLILNTCFVLVAVFVIIIIIIIVAGHSRHHGCYALCCRCCIYATFLLFPVRYISTVKISLFFLYIVISTYSFFFFAITTLILISLTTTFWQLEKLSPHLFCLAFRSVHSHFCFDCSCQLVVSFRRSFYTKSCRRRSL